MTTVEWDKEPHVPVTMTVKVPMKEPLQTRVAVAVVLTRTLEGITEQLSPAGETVALRATLLLKPLRPLRVMVEVPDEPVLKGREVGLAAMEKSGPAALTLIIRTA